MKPNNLVEDANTPMDFSENTNLIKKSHLAQDKDPN